MTIMSADNLRRQGRDAYDNEDYTKALDLFQRAIKRSDPSAQLLDHLAATHERLKDLDAALKATKRTIQTWPEDPTGYLRAGRILVKMDKQSTALDIYNHALRQVKHVGAGYEALKKAQAEALKQVAPQKSIDPLTVLPREMALMVLEYLSFRQRIGISRVSKGWKAFIRSEPNLWAHLDLTGARVKVLNKFVSTAINTTSAKLVAATINKPWDFDKVLAALAGRPTLQRLTLLETGLQGQNMVDSLRRAKNIRELRILRGTEVSQTTLQSLARQHCDKLEVLQCARIRQISFGSPWDFKLPTLTTLDITSESIGLANRLSTKLGEESPQLRSLTLYETAIPASSGLPESIDLRQCQSLQHIKVRLMIQSWRRIHFPPSTRTLDFASSCSSGDFFRNISDADGKDGLRWSNLPNLEELKLNLPFSSYSSIAAGFDITHQDGQEIPNLSKLKSLSMVCPILASEFICEKRLSDLEHLAITSCYALDDRSVEQILGVYKRLRSLNVSGSTITGVAIKDVVKAGHIQELVANDCTKVSRDAVDWAKVQGLNVQFGNTSTQVAGKKVRY